MQDKPDPATCRHSGAVLPYGADAEGNELQACEACSGIFKLEIMRNVGDDGWFCPACLSAWQAEQPTGDLLQLVCRKIYETQEVTNNELWPRIWQWYTDPENVRRGGPWHTRVMAEEIIAAVLQYHKDGGK